MDNCFVVRINTENERVLLVFAVAVLLPTCYYQFHGVMAPTTPMGSFTISELPMV
jgi:hypothetical protein